MSILVPIDVSAPARAAVDVAASLARARDEDLVLIHASPGPRPAPLKLLAGLHDLAEPVRGLGLRVRIRVVTGEPVDSICRWGRDHDASIIVTGTRGPLDLTTERAASTARGLTLCAQVPVIAVRPGVGGLGHGSGAIHVAQPVHHTAVNIAGGLSTEWGRTTRMATRASSGELADEGVVGDENALTIISVDGDQAWPEWCEAMLLRARGTVLVVSRGRMSAPSMAQAAAADSASAR